MLIDGRQLYDLKRQALVWTYAMAGPGRMASRVSDGRTWYVVGTGFDGPATLIAAQLPEEQVEGYVKEVIDGPNAILKPGTHIGVRIDFVGSQAEAVKETARENVYRTLKEYGLVPGAAGDLSIELSVIQKNTGETIEFRKLFGGLGGDARGLLTVKEIELECKTVLSSGAEQLWAPPAQKMRMREIYGIIRLPDKDTNLTDYLYRQLWDRDPGFAVGVGVPRYLAKTANGVVALPGISLLQASRPLTQKPKR